MLQFVVRVGDYGGYMIVETDKPTDIHYVTSVFAAFEFKVEPVVDVMDAVAVWPPSSEALPGGFVSTTRSGFPKG